jgi:hypothetical protein
MRENWKDQANETRFLRGSVEVLDDVAVFPSSLSLRRSFFARVWAEMTAFAASSWSRFAANFASFSLASAGRLGAAL